VCGFKREHLKEHTLKSDPLHCTHTHTHPFIPVGGKLTNQLLPRVDWSQWRGVVSTPS